MIKQRLLKGLIYGVFAVVINFSILSLCVHKNWIAINNGLCVPELLEIVQNPALATITQAVICFVIGFAIGCLNTSSKTIE